LTEDCTLELQQGKLAVSAHVHALEEVADLLFRDFRKRDFQKSLKLVDLDQAVTALVNRLKEPLGLAAHVL